MLSTSAFLALLSSSMAVPLAQSGSSAELTLRGQYRVSPGWGDEWLATLNLSLPLGRLAFSSSPTLAKQPGEKSDEPASDEGQTSDKRATSDARESTGDAPAHATARADEEPAASPASSPEVEHEPNAAPRVTPKLARETVLKALAHAGFGRARVRVASMVARARYSALLPDLRLRAARSTDETLRLTPTLDDPYRYTLAGGSDLLFEASLTWRFDQLLFGEPEMSAERLLAQRAERMQALARQVLDELFDWQRARLARDDPAALPEERQRATLEELEARTRLFVMTGGWFGTTPAFK